MNLPFQAAGRKRHRLVLLAAAAFLSMLGASLALAVPSAFADTPPNLSVTVNPDGSLSASWVMASDQVSMEFLYDTTSGSDGKLTPTATPTCQDGYCGGCPQDTWCWPDQGVPLYCYHVLYNDRAGDCAGHFDLGDSDTSYETDSLQVGATYYVQVLVDNQCLEQETNCPDGLPPDYWSNVVQVVDNPPAAATTTVPAATTTVPGATTTVPGATTTTAETGSASVDFPNIATVPSNGKVNCQTDNWLVQDYDRAAAGRNMLAGQLQLAKQERPELQQKAATATGENAAKLKQQLSQLESKIIELTGDVAKYDAYMKPYTPRYQAVQQACQKPTAANPDPGQVINFDVPPIGNNHTILCRQLKPRVEYLRGELLKLVGNLRFDVTLSVQNRGYVKNEVRRQQIDRRFKTLNTEFLQKYIPAFNACS